MNFLICTKSRLRYGTTYLYCFSIYHGLIFSKRLVGKHLSHCYLRSFYVVQLGIAQIGNNIPARGLQKVKGPVKLIKRVKIAHSLLQSVSDQFHVIILSWLCNSTSGRQRIFRNPLLKMEK